MGKTRATIEAIKAHIEAQMPDTFGIILVSQRNVFQAVDAGMAKANKPSLIIGRTADDKAQGTAAGGRALSSMRLSLTIIVPLKAPGLAGGSAGLAPADEVAAYELFDLGDDLLGALDNKTLASSPSTTFTVRETAGVTDIIDEFGNYVAANIELVVGLLRL